VRPKDADMYITSSSSSYVPDIFMREPGPKIDIVPSSPKIIVVPKRDVPLIKPSSPKIVVEPKIDVAQQIKPASEPKIDVQPIKQSPTIAVEPPSDIFNRKVLADLYKSTDWVWEKEKEKATSIYLNVLKNATKDQWTTFYNNNEHAYNDMFDIVLPKHSLPPPKDEAEKEDDKAKKAREEDIIRQAAIATITR